jgi:hypothetical protein
MHLARRFSSKLKLKFVALTARNLEGVVVNVTK